MSLSIDEGKGGIYFSVKVVPGSKKSKIAGFYGSSLKVKVKSLPQDGKANAEVLTFLAKSLNVPKESIEIVKGEKSRSKTVFLKGYTAPFLRARIGAILGDK